MKCLITPIRSIESVSVDHNDFRILRITFRSRLLVVNGGRRGSNPSTPSNRKVRSSSVSSGTQWHLTCVFESLQHCEWVREKLEIATLYLRESKMEKIKDLLGLGEPLVLPKTDTIAPVTPTRPVINDGINPGSKQHSEIDGAHLALSPTKQKALEKLLSMGFSAEVHDLTGLLERYDGSVEAVVEHVVSTET